MDGSAVVQAQELEQVQENQEQAWRATEVVKNFWRGKRNKLWTELN